MSSNEELVLRAEQAAQQIAQDKAEIQRIEAKFDEVQAPAIAEAKEDIRQAINEKGQTVDETVPFSVYGDRIRRLNVIPPGESVGYPSLKEEDVKYGVSFTNGSTSKTGTFTADATAEASDIAQGKIAYVRGEKVTGTATGGAISPVWEIVRNNAQIAAIVPPSNSIQVPSRKGNYRIAYDGKMFSTDFSYQYKGDLRWDYIDGGLGIANGKLYRLDDSDDVVATPIHPELIGITQLLVLDWGALVSTADGSLYACADRYYVRVEYERDNDTDPVVYVNVGKILNCSQSYMNAWVITADGSLANIWLDKDSFDYGGPGAAYAKIDPADNANGNLFINYYPQTVEDWGGENSITYELAFRADGLWYRQAGTNGGIRYAWQKVDDPGFRQTDWLGYCSLSASENYEWNEETGEENITWTISESQIALHIDEEGSLWRMSISGELDGWELKPEGFNITKVGTDTDWQCVPPSVGRNQSNVFAQKGGKLIKMKSSNSDTIDLTWEDYPLSPPGRMLGTVGSQLWFASEGMEVDLSKAGGTY